MQGPSETARIWAPGRRDALAYTWQPGSPIFFGMVLGKRGVKTKIDIHYGLAAIRNWSQDWGDFFAQAMHAFAGPSRFQYEIQLEKSPQSWEFSRYSQVQSQDTSIVPWCVFYYCRTYYKAVRVGGEESGGHVL